MAVEKIQVINQALTLARGTRIRSVKEKTNSAEIANELYDSVIDDLFSRYVWSFSLRKQQLNRTIAPVNEFRHAHIIPPESKRLWAVYEGVAGDTSVRPTNRYDKQAIGDTEVIVSDSENIVAEFVTRVEPALWSAPFTKLATYALAADMALPLSSDKELQALLYQEAFGTPSQKGVGGRFAIAVQHDVQQKPPTENATSPLEDAMNGLGGGYYG